MTRKTLLKLFVGYLLSLGVILSVLHAVLDKIRERMGPADRSVAPIAASFAAAFLLMLVFIAVGIGLFVYRDARRRGMEPLVWTVIAIFVPYCLGLIIYLIARKPIQIACPSCGAPSPEKAAFCASCGKPLVRTCSKCRAPLQRGARFCHACGQEVGGFDNKGPQQELGTSSVP